MKGRERGGCLRMRGAGGRVMSRNGDRIGSTRLDCVAKSVSSAVTKERERIA